MPPVPSSGKRKRPEIDPPGLVDSERVILNVIRNKKDFGIWIADIKKEAKLADTIFNKSIKSLVAKQLIKDVVNIQNKGKKHYIAYEFEPSKEVSGGDWYENGKINTDLIDILKKVCFRIVRLQSVVTLEGVHKEVKKSRVVTFDISSQQVGEILNLLVLDNDIIEVKSSGLGDYHSIPIGTICYRISSGSGAARGPRMGTFASIPCGACPRISLCTPDGVISPKTCVYYTKWLDIDF